MGQAWRNTLDSSYQFSVEEFIGEVGIPSASSSARGMAYLNALNETWLLHSAEYAPKYGGLLHPTNLVRLF